MDSVLLVDDNVFDREGIVDLIDWNNLGIRIVGTASNGEEGYQKAIDLNPDIIITDIAMPLLNGIQMTRKIKEKLPDTLFIYMSCFDEFDYVKNAITLDVCAYILKPIDIDELTEAVIKVRRINASRNDTKANLEILKDKVRKSLPALREQFLRDLIFNDHSDLDDVDGRISYLGLPSNSKLIIILFQIDNFDLLYGEESVENKYLIVYRIENIVRETVIKNRIGHILVLDTGNLCLMLFDSRSDTETAKEEIIEDCSNCRDRVNESLNMRITIGVSIFSSDVRDASKLFRSANDAIRSKFYGEGNRVILASEVKQPDSFYNYNFGELKKEIELILESGDKEGILKILNKYSIPNVGGGELYAKSLYFSIINAVQIIMNERNENLDSVFENEAVIWDKLNKFETILDIRQWMVNVLISIKEYLDSRQYKRYRTFVEDIRRIVESEYAEIENINEIVDRLYVSSSYGNHIFKQETGKTIFEYLISVRMEKAKEMLADPYCRIYDIAASVGYKSNSYFGAVFKEYAGVTPKQFRDKYCSSSTVR